MSRTALPLALLMVLSSRPADAAPPGEEARPAPSLLFLHDEPSAVPAMLRVQLPAWHVEQRPSVGGSIAARIAHARMSVPPGGAVVWIEYLGIVPRLAMLTRPDEAPRVTPLPTGDSPGFARVVALVVGGLLSAPPLPASSQAERHWLSAALP